MSIFIRSLRGDFQKLRRNPIIWIHIIIPILMMIMFLSYYSFSKIDAANKVSGYIEVLAMGFPLVIGVITSMAVDQEALAGSFHELLMSRYKLMSFFSKVCMLSLLGLFALFVAIGGFFLGFQFLLNQNIFPSIFYVKIIFLLFFSQIFIYLIHLLCSFKFGTGASIGLGIGESLIAALMITGLGDGIWKVAPCAWGIRFSNYYVALNSNMLNNFYVKEFNSGIFICSVMTVILLFISLLWFYYFEGRKEN